MEIKKNGVLWAKIDGDTLKLRLPPEFLGELNSDENVLIMTESNWEKIFITLKHLSKGALEVGCMSCGAKAEYKAGKESLAFFIPQLCERCYNVLTKKQKSYFERIIEE